MNPVIKSKKPIKSIDIDTSRLDLDHLSLTPDNLLVKRLETRLSLIFCDVGGCFYEEGHSGMHERCGATC